MVLQDSLLAALVRLVDCLPMPQPPTKRGQGHPKVYTDRPFLKALVIMIVAPAQGALVGYVPPLLRPA